MSINKILQREINKYVNHIVVTLLTQLNEKFCKYMGFNLLWKSEHKSIFVRLRIYAHTNACFLFLFIVHSSSQYNNGEREHSRSGLQMVRKGLRTFSFERRFSKCVLSLALITVDALVNRVVSSTSHGWVSSRVNAVIIFLVVEKCNRFWFSWTNERTNEKGLTTLPRFLLFYFTL